MRLLFDGHWTVTLKDAFYLPITQFACLIIVNIIVINNLIILLPYFYSLTIASLSKQANCMIIDSPTIDNNCTEK